MREGAIVLILCIALFACGEIAEKKRTAPVATNLSVRLAQPGFRSDIRDYKIRTGQMLALNDTIMGTFKCRLHAEHKQSNPYYKGKIAVLEEQNNQLKKKLKDYNATKKKDWERFKQEFTVELVDLGESYRDLGISNTHPEVVCK